MTEAFLYFLWQFRLFNHLNLRTTAGEPVEILQPGHRNAHAGPDFANARLRIGEVEWGGTVEMHVRAGEWHQHGHQHDCAYDNVVLHVVWQDDQPVLRSNGQPLPTLALQERTDSALVLRYGQLIEQKESIPCAGQFGNVAPLVHTATLDKVGLQRLERRAQDVAQIATDTGHDWDETAWRLLARVFGQPVNAEPMAQLARILPLRILRKHQNQPTQLEALLFGAAGLFPEDIDETDTYLALLRREWSVLSVKYNVAPLPAHVWKWARLRPASFPTRRLAQVAALLAYQTNLFALLTQEEEAATLLTRFRQPLSAYWQRRYRFGPESDQKTGSLGVDAARHVLINATVPLLAAYAHHRAQPAYIDRAVALLEEVPAEQNNVVDQWRALGLTLKTAFDTQAALELYQHCCQPKHCLRCPVGVALMRG